MTFGPNDAGPVTNVSCETKDGLTTISIEAKMPASVVLTEGASPTVQSVKIGDVNGEGSSLTYLAGLSGVPVVAARDGKGYTVTGTGMGIDPNQPAAPVDMPFDIAVTCP